MTKVTRLAVILLVALSSVGCVDLYQHLTKDAAGKISVYFRASFSKALAEVAGVSAESSGTGMLDDMAAGMGTAVKELADTLGGQFEDISTDVEIGVQVQLTYDAKSNYASSFSREKQWPVVPEVRQDAIIMRFPKVEGAGDLDHEQMRVLSAFKYRLSISRRMTPTISRVEFSNDHGEYTPAVTALPDVFLIEIPINQLLSGGGSQLSIYL
jgi:hypothetical protein